MYGDHLVLSLEYIVASSDQTNKHFPNYIWGTIMVESPNWSYLAFQAVSKNEKLRKIISTIYLRGPFTQKVSSYKEIHEF